MSSIFEDCGCSSDEYMLKAAYDPTDISQDAFDMENMVEGATHKILTDTDRTLLDNTSGTNTGDQDLSALALKSNVLELDNTDAFTPDADYEPATKKYVDDSTLDISCRVTKSAVQSIAHDTPVVITWDQESYDTDIMHDTVVDNDRITFKTAGKYLVTAQAAWQSNSDGARIIDIAKNGNTGQPIARVNVTRSPAPAGPTGGEECVTYMGEFAVNDYVEVAVYQSSGVALDFLAGSPAVEETYLGVHRL